MIFVLRQHRFYDSLSRLLSADYDNGVTVYNYGYDEAGNMVNMDGTTRTYNAANQMTYDGTNTLTYDNNGNLTAVGADSYTWDRANRLLSYGGISYAYDGLGNRISQDTLKYLLDVQPGLTVVLGDSDSNHFVHAVRGIHAQEDNLGNWKFMAQDGLGSVRGLVDGAAVVQSSMSYDPYGNPMGSYGAGFGFTGEQIDANDLLYLRARYYEPSLGVFSALDTFEGLHSRPMSLNGYSWVEGNPVMNTDPTGMTCECDEYLNNSDWMGFINCVSFKDNHHVQTPTPVPTAIQQSGGTDPDDIIRDSTVTIGIPDPSAGTCDHSPHTRKLQSLGTLTARGIITHDHFLPYIGTGRDSIQETDLGKGAYNPTEAKTNILTWPCMIITGKNGDVELATHSINFGASTVGSLVIEPNQTDIKGNAVNLLNLGTQVTEDTTWNPVEGERIRVAHINGKNESANIYNHSVVGVFWFNIDSPTLKTRFQRQAYVLNTIWWGYRDRPDGGDSGGGVFNQAGNLVGVTLEVAPISRPNAAGTPEPTENFFTTGFEYGFVPL